MRWKLTLVCLGILVAMTVVTVRASLVRPVWDNAHLLSDPWFIATLCDAYCGFLLFYVWVAWRERSLSRRLIWFVAIMLLGNFAMAAYVLIRLARLDRREGVERLLVGPVEE
jgi:hypothetical protein